MEGSTVYLVGIRSGVVAGRVTSSDADITAENASATGVCIVHYERPTDQGDSGAPILSALADGALCYGVHGGAIKGRADHYFTPFGRIEWQ